MTVPQNFLIEAATLRSEMDEAKRGQYAAAGKQADLFKARTDAWIAAGLKLAGDEGAETRKELLKAAFGETPHPRKSEWDALWRYSPQWAALEAGAAALIADDTITGIRDRWTALVRTARETKKNAGTVPDVRSLTLKCQPKEKGGHEKANDGRKRIIAIMGDETFKAYYPGIAALKAQVEAFPEVPLVAPAPAPVVAPVAPAPAPVAAPVAPAAPVGATGFDMADILGHLQQQGAALAALADKVAKL